MNLPRLINLNLALLGALATSMVGLGGVRLLIVVGVLIIAVAAHYYCDRLQRLSVSPWMVNLAVLAAAAVAVIRFSQVTIARDVEIAADSLIGLQAVLLFERKTTRTWWDLFSLSLLLVFLSCGFDHGPMFAVLLSVYFFFALSALALLALHREQQRCAHAEFAESNEQPERTVDRWRLAGLGVATLVVGPLSLYLRFRLSAGEPLEGPTESPPQEVDQKLPPWKRRPLLEVPQYGNIRIGATRKEYAWRLGRMTMGCLVVGVVVFCITPRFRGIESMLRGRRSAWNTSSNAAQRTVGFTNEVQLGQLGSVINDTQRVLSIRFTDPIAERPYEMQGSLFLRGAVLNQYDNGTWEHRLAGAPVFPRYVEDRLPSNLVVQRIRLEPLDREEVFCVWPIRYLHQDDRLQFAPRSERLIRPGSLRRRPFSYEVGTIGIDGGHQAALVPAETMVDSEELLQYPQARLPRLTALAQTWLDQSGIAENDRLTRVRLLESRLRSSDRFQYRLGDHQRDESLDPIEDFVVNDPSGHCEYFASALALMLRSQGLPARMVVGFKTDEFNYVEQRYWARQSHAHSWVEAFIPADAIPAEAKSQIPDADWSYGGWLRLDPTPSNYDELSFIEYMKRSITRWRGALQTAWSQHVMQMSETRQNAMIYRPLMSAIRNLFSGGDWFAAIGRTDLSSLVRSPLRLLQSLLVLLLVIAAMVGGPLALIRMRRRRRNKGSANSRKLRGIDRRRAGTAIGPEFYRRWESVLQRWGLLRDPAQTPREFARMAGSQLADAADQPELCEAASAVAEAFYEVRFGGTELDPQEHETIERNLKQIQQAIQRTRKEP